MAVFDQNSFFRIPLERFANFHKIAGSSQNDLAMPSSRRARRAESIGTNVVAWRRIDPFFRPKTLSLRAIGLNTHQHIIGPRRGTENKTGKRSSFRGGRLGERRVCDASHLDKNGWKRLFRPELALQRLIRSRNWKRPQKPDRLAEAPFFESGQAGALRGPGSWKGEGRYR